MPLNPENSRNASTTLYLGLTYPVTLRRRNADGTMKTRYDQNGQPTLPVQENWVAYTESQTEQTEGNQVLIRRDWLMFNDGCGGSHAGPPSIGDQIVWQCNGSAWDIPLDAVVTANDTFNYGFDVRNTVRAVPPVNG